MLSGLSVWLDRSLLVFLARVIYWHWCVSSYFIGWWGNTWLYSWTWCPSVLPLVELHALHRSVVPTGVIVLLGLCNPPRWGCGEPAKPGLLYTLVWIPCCGIVFAGVAKQSRVLNNYFGRLGNMPWYRARINLWELTLVLSLPTRWNLSLPVTWSN
jgi:hypothetical protein